jgi:hypothetical protein
MAYSINGIGTQCYGERDFRSDGSYVTTKWFTILYVPVFPLQSWRVKYQGAGEARWNLSLGSSDTYSIYEKRLPDWRQVSCTYGYMALLVLWTYAVGTAAFTFFPKALNNALYVFLIFAFCTIPVPTPWILRHFARRKIRAEFEAKP